MEIPKDVWNELFLVYLRNNSSWTNEFGGDTLVVRGFKSDTDGRLFAEILGSWKASDAQNSGLERLEAFLHDGGVFFADNINPATSTVRSLFTFKGFGNVIFKG